MIKILIADDHAIVRGGLKQIIATTTDIVVAGEAAQGPTAAAIANAVFDALGVRVRDLPLTAERIRAAIG